jgi:hypothetical protein
MTLAGAASAAAMTPSSGASTAAMTLAPGATPAAEEQIWPRAKFRPAQ